MNPIAVVIVNYNTSDHLRSCLASVMADSPDDVIVVDNASSDDSTEMVRAEYPNVVLHANESNVGYGAAANQAIDACNAPYVLLLNSDTLLRPGTLEALRLYLDEHPRAAIVGPRLVNSDGSPQVSCYSFPSPRGLFFDRSNLSQLLRYVPFLRERSLRVWSHNTPRVVPWVMGAALLIRREAFKVIHGFDESFFMYFEEVDCCYRLAQAGWETHFSPSATVVHAGGASTKQRRVTMAEQYFRSEMQFYRRHYSKSATLQFQVVLATMMLTHIVVDNLRCYLTRDPWRRARQAEDLGAWREILVSLGPFASGAFGSRLNSGSVDKSAYDGPVK